MPSSPAMAVLSESLEGALRGRPVKAAVFVTFQLDPGFFGLHLLPLLFPSVAAERPQVRRAQLEEALREVDHLAVFYDRHGLVDGSGTSRLVYDRIPVSISTGVLHSKNVFLLVGPEKDDDPDESLLVVTTSANLTESGWWRNVEVAHIHEIPPGTRDALRYDLLSTEGSRGLLERLSRLDRTGRGRAPLHRIRQYLLDRVQPEPNVTRSRLLVPRLFSGGRSFPEFLSEEAGIDKDTYCLEVISPFFDLRKDAATLKEVLDAVGPTRTRVFLPRDESGRALCSEDHFDAVSEMPRVEWGTLPPAVTKWSTKQEDSPDRFVHAKVYRFFSPSEQWEIQAVGSVNLTHAAHRGRGGNLESAVVIDTSNGRKADWWLGRLGDDRPGEFVPRPSEDDPERNRTHPVTLRFDWKTGLLGYLWEKETVVPRLADLVVKGVSRTSFTPSQFGDWKDLSAEKSAPFRDVLLSTAFIDLIVDTGPPQRLLILELNGPSKPSIIEDLTPEEILEYWSLLSQEQRDAFAERKILALLALQGSVDELATTYSHKGDDPPSMFDRFAGIFHAFSCLEERLENAFDKGEAQADKLTKYLLFGKKYDSLPSLLTMVLDPKEEDRVNQYVTLLCSRQLLRRLEDHHPEFMAKRSEELLELHDLIQRGDSIKDDLDFDADEHGADFLEWFERAFLGDVALPEGAGGKR